ncbi:dihydropyrimidinase [Pseudaquabacterium rugosum]|uniref:Dihydropyrimidinase n=1 Tax=Pseudaquabacterium rugosum TaxID=2984194 RepID=A0ABU9B9Z1_9BURK
MSAPHETPLPTLDLTIRNALVQTSRSALRVDVGVRDGRIVALAPDLPPGREDVDATGLWLLPGGVDSHCHVEQLSSAGVMCADDFESASVSAAFGGTTTIVPFAAQHRGMAIPEVLADYHRRAAARSVIDYGFHLILADPTEEALSTDLPQAIRDGITSLKVFMTYDKLKLDDYQMLQVLACADEHGALVMVHAENHDMIRWIAEQLLRHGHRAPRFHTVAHDASAEGEATNRAIALARLLEVPVMLVHVSAPESIEMIRSARRLGAPVYGESCPQYLYLTAEDTARPGLEGAKFCCSPPPRDAAGQAAVFDGLMDGTLSLYSSDHAPFRFDESGKLPKGPATHFKEMANGVPGLELRLPLLFSDAVVGGRMSPQQFVQLTATRHAELYGMAPRKGDIVLGADADLALWDPTRRTTVRAEQLHDRVGYSPYEGRELTGWPVQVWSRGRCVVRDAALQVAPGSGRFIVRGRPGALPAPTSGKPAWMRRLLPELAD